MDNELVQLLRSVIREELEPVHERLGVLETSQQSILKEQQIIRQEQQIIKQEQQKIIQNQQLLLQEQEMIKLAVLETNERVIRIEAIVENQHRIIELLSARSIEQEAQIKRIK